MSIREVNINGQRPKNKTDAVRAALATGLTSPTAVVRYIREQFGMEVSDNLVSTVKSTERQKKGSKAAGTSRQARFEVVELEPVEVGTLPAPARLRPDGQDVEDLLTLARLAEQVGGVDRLGEFLGALGRVAR